MYLYYGVKLSVFMCFKLSMSCYSQLSGHARSACFVYNMFRCICMYAWSEAIINYLLRITEMSKYLILLYMNT